MIILIGKTATGKDTIRKELNKLGFDSVVTYTTRPIRNGEIDGIDYHFISQRNFLQKKMDGFFAETTSYQVSSGETWDYGSALENLSDNKVMIVNPSGVQKLQKLSCINPIVFYLLANDEVIWNRLRKRGDSSEEARRRLNTDNQDFKDIEKYVDCVIRNEYLKPALVAEIIKYTYNKMRRD